MFQSSFFDNDDASAIKDAPLKSSIFTGNSLLCNGRMSTLMGSAKKPLPARITSAGDSVDVYRNLNKYELFSIKQRSGEHKGRVTGYARSVVIKHPCFAIGEVARQKILVVKSRSVHAYVRGSFVDGIDGDINLNQLNDYIRVSYSPYVAGSFYTLERDKEGQIIHESITPFNTPENYLYAIVNGADVILTNDAISE